MENREIKFRVWDGERMTSQIRLEFAHGLRLVSTDDLGFGRIGDDKCVLMQFTGLNDKNDQKIYEGDILKCLSNPGLIRGIVVYENGSFGIRDNENQWQGMLANKNPCEVIGNIYENIDLLQ